jgi:hypothetical protein
MSFAGILQYAPNPTAAENLNDPAPRVAPGALQCFNGNWYRYVKFDNGAANVATTSGHPAFWKTKSTFLVSSDKTDCQHGASNASGACGVFLGVVTDGYYTWVQLTGIHPTVVLSGAGAAGQHLTIPASDVDAFTVGAWTTVASQVCGVQLDTVDATHGVCDLWMLYT